jgi:hypothetical protein
MDEFRAVKVDGKRFFFFFFFFLAKSNKKNVVDLRAEMVTMPWAM